MKNYLVVCALLAGALGTVSGCTDPAPNASPAAVTGTDTAPPLVPSPAPPVSESPTAKPRTVTIYSVAEDREGNRSLKAQTKTLPDDFKQTPALFALEELMNTVHSPIPSGTKLRSVKIGAGGAATVDFSQEFKDNFTGGDTNEALTINALCATLAQFPSVQTVQILLDGKKIDSLGGNQSLDEPLSVRDAPKESPAP